MNRVELFEIICHISKMVGHSVDNALSCLDVDMLFS